MNGRTGRNKKEQQVSERERGRVGEARIEMDRGRKGGEKEGGREGRKEGSIGSLATKEGTELGEKQKKLPPTYAAWRKLSPGDLGVRTDGRTATEAKQREKGKLGGGKGKQRRES